jgi:FixJ family two-component response regulator
VRIIAIVELDQPQSTIPTYRFHAGPYFRKISDGTAAVSRAEIYVVDDDIEIRQILALTLSEAGYDVTCFADGPSLMSATRAKAPACILLDIGLPGPSGLQILEKLRNRGDLTPIIIVSGANDIRTAVEAFKKGAIDYVEKPFSGSDLLARVEEAISTTSGAREAPKLPSNFPGCELLSQREWEILERCAVGASTREIAKLLALSPRTVEEYRTRLLRKLGARNIAEVMRKVLSA